MSLPPRIEAATARSKPVREAVALAREAHAGQIRNGSGGMPYIDHPIAVADLLAEHGYGDQVLAAALLHDVIEESEIEVPEIEERFGGPIAELVGALTDEAEIEPYQERKDLHRRQVEECGEDAIAIYAADKLANVRALRRVYAVEGEMVGDELKAPLDVKVGVWESDLEVLRAMSPAGPFYPELSLELEGLREDRTARV